MLTQKPKKNDDDNKKKKVTATFILITPLLILYLYSNKLFLQVQHLFHSILNLLQYT